MLFLYYVLLAGCALLLLGGVVEQRRHIANLNRIPRRIMVNGIRGKSSITRLCAGALRGGGLVTVAKTTGTAARFIHPDASEEPVYRKFGIANVIEQIGIVRRASAYRPDALVIECMAVMPDLQAISQDKLIRSNVGVLCNVREDHLAEMGPTLDDVARSLSRTMPAGGVCVTAERERLPLLKREAARRDCRLLLVDPDSVTDEEMAGFSWITFKENVAIAIAVAALLGVNRSSALAGMQAAPPDPGVLEVKRYLVDGSLLRVANVFAANDPRSTLMNVRRLLASGSIGRPLHLVINCRPDRMERNGQMGALVADIEPERIVLIGTPTRSARAAIPQKWHDAILDLGGTRDATELVDEIVDGIDDEASLVAVGNIHGQGELLLEQLDTLPAAPATALPQPPPARTQPDPLPAPQPPAPQPGPPPAPQLGPPSLPQPSPASQPGRSPAPQPDPPPARQPGPPPAPQPGPRPTRTQPGPPSAPQPPPAPQPQPGPPPARTQPPPDPSPAPQPGPPPARQPSSPPAPQPGPPSPPQRPSPPQPGPPPAPPPARQPGPPSPKPAPELPPSPAPRPRVADIPVRSRPPWANGPITRPLPRVRDRGER